jgi:hypothetical protein
VRRKWSGNNWRKDGYTIQKIVGRGHRFCGGWDKMPKASGQLGLNALASQHIIEQFLSHILAAIHFAHIK